MLHTGMIYCAVHVETTYCDDDETNCIVKNKGTKVYILDMIAMRMIRW